MYIYLYQLIGYCSVMSDSLWPHRPQPTLSVFGFSSKNTGVGCQFHLQGIFLTQGSNLHLLCLQCHLRNLFIYLAVSGFSCSTWDFPCIMWDVSLCYTDSRAVVWAQQLAACGLQSMWVPVVAACELSYSVACGILVPQPWIKLASPALEGEFLTTGPPGKSPAIIF